MERALDKMANGSVRHPTLHRVPAMNFEREGTGEPLVLIHGVGHHLQGWRPVVARLRDRFEVISVDSPGFGASAPLPAGVAPTIEAYVDRFAAFLGERGLDRPHVAGNSMGGAIAIELARRGLVRSACAISPFGFQSKAEWAYGKGLLLTTYRTPAPLRVALRAAVRPPAVRKAVLAGFFARADRMPVEEVVASLDDIWGSPVMDQVVRGMAGFAFGPEPLRLDVPVTVAWGSKDRLLPFGRQAPRARRLLPGAMHVTLDGLGHTPMFDDPDRVAEVMVRATQIQG